MKVLRKIETEVRALITRWWRPSMYVGIVTAIWVNTVWSPIVTGASLDLAAMAVLFVSVAPLAGIRAYERLKERQTDDPPPV